MGSVLATPGVLVLTFPLTSAMPPSFHKEEDEGHHFQIYYVEQITGMQIPFSFITAFQISRGSHENSIVFFYFCLLFINPLPGNKGQTVESALTFISFGLQRATLADCPEVFFFLFSSFLLLHLSYVYNKPSKIHFVLNILRSNCVRHSHKPQLI